MSPQSALDGCVSAGCLEKRATVDPQSELRPASFTPRRAVPNVKSARVARTPRPTPVAAKSDKPPSDQEPNPTASVEEKHDALTIIKPEPGATRKAKTTIAAKLDAPTSDLSSETSDPVLKKARISIAAKMEDPTSAEFEDMRRAIRKNAFGQRIDSICGRVKGKKVSGEAIGERPFLYLVKEDEAYVVVDNPNSVAGTAYRTICLDALGNDSQ